jgi:hypothetical protein
MAERREIISKEPVVNKCRLDQAWVFIRPYLERKLFDIAGAAGSCFEIARAAGSCFEMIGPGGWFRTYGSISAKIRVWYDAVWITACLRFAGSGMNVSVLASSGSGFGHEGFGRVYASITPHPEASRMWTTDLAELARRVEGIDAVVFIDKILENMKVLYPS